MCDYVFTVCVVCCLWYRCGMAHGDEDGVAVMVMMTMMWCEYI